MLKFEGRNSRGDKHYYAEADSAIKLYEELVRQGIISIEDGDPYDVARFSKATGRPDRDFSKAFDDYEEDHEDDAFAYSSFMNQFPDLTDDEIIDLIKSCNGNAYYQKITDNVSVDYAAETLGVSRTRIYALIKSGKLVLDDNEITYKSVLQYKGNRKNGRPWKK